MEVVCLILGPMLASQPCLHAFWVLTSLHFLSFLLKMFFIILVVTINNFINGGRLSILGLKDVKKPCMAQCLWFQLITSAVLLWVVLKRAAALLPGTCTCITSFVGSFQSVYSLRQMFTHKLLCSS